MNLPFEKVSEHKDLVPAVIYDFLTNENLLETVKVAEINPDYADGDLLSQHYDIPIEMEVNCLVVEGKRQERVTYAAVLVPYGKRANTASPTKRALDVSKVSFSPLDYVLQESQMEFGSITPLGLPQDWHILIDSALLEQEELVIGGGLVKSKLLIPSQVLTKLPNAQIVENLAK